MSRVNYKATFNRLLIKRAAPKQVGSLILPSEGEYVDGVIVSVGGGAGKRDGLAYTVFEEGQLVKYSKAKVVAIELDAQFYDLITDEFVILIKV